MVSHHPTHHIRSILGPVPCRFRAHRHCMRGNRRPCSSCSRNSWRRRNNWPPRNSWQRKVCSSRRSLAAPCEQSGCRYRGRSHGPCSRSHSHSVRWHNNWRNSRLNRRSTPHSVTTPRSAMRMRATAIRRRPSAVQASAISRPRANQPFGSQPFGNQGFGNPYVPASFGQQFTSGLALH